MRRAGLLTSTRPGSTERSELARRLAGRYLVLASHRGPLRYHLQDGRPRAVPASGGLVSALSALACQVPLTWVSAADGPAERLVALQPSPGWRAPGAPRVRLVLAPPEALEWSYCHFANPVLWFLQHGLWDRLDRRDLPARMERGWRLGYQPVNEAFARVVADEVRGADAPLVQFHDYHLYLAPLLLRRLVPRARVLHFTHIPWPEPAAWLSLPYAMRRDLCEGLLGADVVGFQTEASAAHFLECCERFVPGARVDQARREVWLEGRRTLVRAYPISVDPAALRRLAARAETRRHLERLEALAGERTIVRVDRLDPSKNIVLGFKAYARLLERWPELVGRVRFLAFLVPTRSSIPEYRRYAQEVEREVAAINGRFARGDWRPIEVFYEDNRPQAMAGLALADVLLVNALADGMNLVAKEGIVLGERDPALVLSTGCGAHAQLGLHALSIAPDDLEGTALALKQALDMPLPERRRRAAALRARIEAQDLAWWAERQFDDLLAQGR